MKISNYVPKKDKELIAQVFTTAVVRIILCTMNGADNEIVLKSKENICKAGMSGCCFRKYSFKCF